MSCIYIYGDSGVGQFGLGQLQSALERALPNTPIKTLNANDVIEGQWRTDALLFAMPGGRDIFYCEKLRGAGNSQIRDFVHCGGHYLGICAGAYYGSGTVHFALESPLEVKGARELAFFPGVAKGPLFAANSFSYDSSFGVDNSGATAAPIRYRDSVVQAYYNGGCGFINAEQHISCEILGWYEELKIPCIIRCQCGKGTALLSGIHLEFDANDLPPSTPEKVREVLLESRDEQRNLFTNLVTKELLQTATGATVS